MNFFKRVGHWSPRYVYSRTQVFLFRQRYGGPSLATGAVRFLMQWLKPTDVMLEYGSGFSTAWFGQRVSKLISVENDPVWYARVTKELSRYELRNVELHLLNTGPILAGTAVGADYISILEKYPPESFDVVLNDGWARAYVGSRLDLVKPGGLFIWDDYAGSFPTETHIPGALESSSVISHPQLLDFVKRTATWRKVVWDDGTHSTGFFFRP